MKIQDMNSSIDLPHPTFSNLSLSPLVLDDASEMFNHLIDEETVKYLIGPPFPLTMDQIKDYISSRPLINKYNMTYAIRDHRKMINEVSLVSKETQHTYELGYYLARPYWNNGIITVAVKTYLNAMMKRINVNGDIRIEAGYLVDNLGSEKVLQKCGFTKIGHEKKTKNGQIYQGIKMVRYIVSEEQRNGLIYPQLNSLIMT